MIATTSRLTVCVLAMLGVAQVACKPTGTPAASGGIVLEHVSTSESDIVFVLINGSDRTIRVRGGRTLTLAVRPWPGDTGVDCTSDSPFRMEEEPIGFAYGNPGSVEVAPGERVRLKIATELPHRHVGGHCRLKLILQDGTVVGPTEFQP